MSKIILVTGAAGGPGAATARALADSGHTAYAGIDPASGRSLAAAPDPDGYARGTGARPRPISLDMSDQRSVTGAVQDIVARSGRVNAVIHTVGPLPQGPVEAFTPYQLAQIYDAHVLSTQRVNRAVLPQMRERRDGLLVWVVSGLGDADSQAAPYLTLHTGALTLIDHLGAGYARELISFGIETTIVVCGPVIPGLGTHPRMVQPDDIDTARAYEDRLPGRADEVAAAVSKRSATDEDIARLARTIAAVVDSPKGERPARVTVGPPDGEA